jgi:hypothetical protein
MFVAIGDVIRTLQLQNESHLLVRNACDLSSDVDTHLRGQRREEVTQHGQQQPPQDSVGPSRTSRPERGEPRP